MTDDYDIEYDGDYDVYEDFIYDNLVNLYGWQDYRQTDE